MADRGNTRAAARSVHLVLPDACFYRTRVRLARGDAVSVHTGARWGAAGGELLLPHLATLPGESCRLGLESRHELDILADEPPQHSCHVGDDLVQVEHARPKHLLTTESKKLACEVRGTLSRLLNFHDILPDPVFRFQSQKGRLAVSDDQGQEVVEVVGDATREPPDRLHLVGLA